MRAIRFDELPGLGVGHAHDLTALTGCTVLVFPDGAVAGHVALGVASGSRELAALTPRHRVEKIHGICLAGGSAFGLAAAAGVMRRLEAAGIGHLTSFARVPIVAGAVVYDLNLGDPRVRPDEAMGEAATEAALAGGPAASGCVGAGAGVCAGKLLGAACATKTGLGQAGLEGPDGLRVAALVVANPVGDILDPRGRGILAGTRRAPDSLELAGSAHLIRQGLRWAVPTAPNTVLAVVATSAALNRLDASWLAEQAAVALARGVDPPFTRHDGDVVFAVGLGQQSCDPHLLGLLARDCLAAALEDACRSATPAAGLPSAASLRQPGDPGLVSG